MHIEHNYLKELIDDEERVYALRSSISDKEHAEKSEADEESPEDFGARFTDRMNQLRDEDHAQKRAAGLCMSVSAFKSLAAQAHELAARVGMDYDLDRRPRYGMFTFIIQFFDLFKIETPELNESFAFMLARAEQISIAPVRRYNRHLIELSLTYYLDE